MKFTTNKIQINRGLVITTYSRHRLLMVKEDYEPQVATHVENMLRKKFDKLTDEDDVDAAVTAALVDMRGAARKKRKGDDRTTGDSGNFRQGRPRRR